MTDVSEMLLRKVKDGTLQIEWDEKKRLSNIGKHNLDFIDVAGLFAGAAIDEARRTPHEARWKAINVLNGTHVTIIFAVRSEVVRVMSMRRARRDERGRYQALHHPRVGEDGGGR